MRLEGAYGVTAWSSARWRQSAVEWIDQQLAAAGIERTGPVEQPRLRPWGTVLKAPTAGGPVWLKAVGPGAAFEPGLCELLARMVPRKVLAPLGTDPARGWLLLPDGGPSLGEQRTGTHLVEGLERGLVQYGQLQRELGPHVDELLALGLTDMSPAVMPARFHEARAAVQPTGDAARRLAEMEPIVASWCDRLAASPLPPSLDHNDLHPWNILDDGTGDARYYDWGDSVVAHPFAAARLPLLFVQRALNCQLDDPRLLGARTAYLEVFADLASAAELAETLELACQVAKIARALTWERALSAAREQGEAVEDDWATAPLETLTSLFDESYLAGG